jgi:acetyl-CoA hydrolase
MIRDFANRIVNPEKAVEVVKSGDRVYLHANSCYPELLVKALCERYNELNGVEICHLTSFTTAPYVAHEMSGHFRHNALFTGNNVRKAVQEGRADFTPIFLSEIPILFESGKFPIDVCFLHLSMPDAHGYCSFGVSNECSKIAAENSRIIVAQINKKMPRVLGDNFIHIDKINYIVECDLELPELAMSDPNMGKEEKAVYRLIAENISTLIKDGDTLQMGIGAIPDAVLPYLREKNDLGIHTEMFSDGLIDLIELGVVNGDKKSLLPGKVVSSFIIGTKKIFDYIDDNSLIEFRTSKFVNDPFIIARNDNMISINSCIQVDITGQVCSDSIGPKIYSGFGGQVDFIRGSARSKNGKPIIAFASTCKNDTVSKITPFLTEGAGVTTSRGDVHYLITEWGIADLFGKTLRQRAELLIGIAHPNFRDELTQRAKELKFL